MKSEVVDIKEAQLHLKQLLKRIVKGEQIILRDNEKPIAKLLPISERVPGLHAGNISTSGDFDEPLPDEYWTGNE